MMSYWFPWCATPGEGSDMFTVKLLRHWGNKTGRARVSLPYTEPQWGIFPPSGEEVIGGERRVPRLLSGQTQRTPATPGPDSCVFPVAICFCSESYYWKWTVLHLIFFTKHWVPHMYWASTDRILFFFQKHQIEPVVRSYNKARRALATPNH